MDWKLLKDIAQQVGRELGDKVKDLSNQVAEQTKEAWNSEEAQQLRQKAQVEANKASAWADNAVREVSAVAKHATTASASAVEGVSTMAKQVATASVNAFDKVSASTKQAVADSAKAIEEAWNSEEIVRLRTKTKELVSLSADKASEIWNSERAVKLRGSSKNALRVVTGIRAIEARKNSIRTREEADTLKAEVESTNEAIREDLNEHLASFGRYRLEALSATVGRFLRALKQMQQRAKSKEYEFLSEIDIPLSEIKEMERVDMKASEALKVTTVGGLFAGVGIAGTPVVVTAMVTQFCAASTGVAISNLSGAAATNAVLAWLGGGAVAHGGGGMAVGAIVMGGITATATIGVTLLAVGTLASQFYIRKETEAEAYLAEVKEWVAKIEASWSVIAHIKSRVDELHDVTERLLAKSQGLMTQLEEIVPIFDNENMEHVKLFQQCAITAKSMSELAQTPILDEEGNINEDVSVIAKRTEKVINSEL